MVTFHWGVLGIEQNTYRILEVIHQADEVKFLQPPTHKSFTFYVFFFFFEDFKWSLHPVWLELKTLRSRESWILYQLSQPHAPMSLTI